MKLNLGLSDSITAIIKYADLFVLGCVAIATLATYAAAQVAGFTAVGAVVTEEVADSWSAKRQMLNQPLFNEHNEKIGTSDDILVTPDKAISYAIVGSAGFVCTGRHDVAIPFNQFKKERDKFVLAGATKETIKALPSFEYAR
jgi:hypothetical protein